MFYHPLAFDESMLLNHFKNPSSPLSSPPPSLLPPSLFLTHLAAIVKSSAQNTIAEEEEQQQDRVDGAFGEYDEETKDEDDELQIERGDLEDAHLQYDDETEAEDDDLKTERGELEDAQVGPTLSLLEGKHEQMLKLEVLSLTVKERKELASYAHSLGKKLKSQLVGKYGVISNLATSFIETLEANKLLKEMAESRGTSASDESLKIAIAVSLLRSKLLNNTKEPRSLSPSQSDALLRWKRKAKERKQEIQRLREDLKESQDVSQCDLFPESASCKCYFFGNLGQSSAKHQENGSDNRFNDVLRRRFLRQVRFKERKRKIASSSSSSSSSSQQRLSSGLIEEDETEQLRASVDFLVELCESVSPVDDSKFGNLAHQAVDFILVSLKNLLSIRRNLELVEGIINNLVTRLIRQMCRLLSENGSQHTGDTNARFSIQHLIRKLGSEPYIGQRAILSVCQRILVLAERLLFSDPFDDAFPDMHECMFMMIQLIEFLVADYLVDWSKAEHFDNRLLEDWVTSIIQARKALELLESRNGLYALYMDRVIGELAKQVGGVSSLQKLKPDIFNCLFH